MTEIIVCMKIIIDPEAPASIFDIDRINKKPIPPQGMPPVFSPFDLNALEAALKIKDRQTCKISVLTMGKNPPKALLQKTLAMGADDAVVVSDSDFEHLDPHTTARILTEAIRKIRSFDLVFTGRQAADWDSGTVWAGIAHFLNLPCITMARSAEIQDNKVIVQRCVSDGIETLETDLPALITFSSEVGEPRFASLQAMMKAGKKPVQKWTSRDISVESFQGLIWEDLREPAPYDIDCRFITGEDNEQKGRALARIIKEQLETPTAPGGAK